VQKSKRVEHWKCRGCVHWKLISVALLAAPLVLSGFALAATSATKDEAVAMVKKAVAAINSEGPDKKVGLGHPRRRRCSTHRRCSHKNMSIFEADEHLLGEVERAIRLSLRRYPGGTGAIGATWDVYAAVPTLFDEAMAAM
jgi:hypothetical protein